MAPFQNRGRNNARAALKKSIASRQYRDDYEQTRTSPRSSRRSGISTPVTRVADSAQTQTQRLSRENSAGEDAEEDGRTSVAAESVTTEAEPDAYELYQTRAEDEQKLFIRETVRRIFGFEGREGQIKAIHHFLFKQSDLVLIAKTSFGKSLIFQAVSAIRKRSITIIIIPLTRVGQGQYEKLRQLEGCNPCLLTAKTSSKSIFQRMKRGDFSHILTSPELAVSEPFRELCVDPGFGDRVSMVAIDEFHLVAQWGRDWRPEYARCHVLRDRLGPQVRWFACSATLDERTLRMAMTDTSFTDETCIMRHSIDRPELSLCVFKIPSCTMSRYDALFFLIKPGRSANGLATPMEIPKTVVFLDSRVGVQAACKALRGMLLKYCDKYTPAEVQRRIGVYHANLADVDKDSYYADFQTVQSNRRIIVATDALGLGVDISDISVVVQYGIPRSDGLSAIMQRWGRAARGRNRTGIVALLAEDWSFVTPATDSQRGIARSMLCRRNKQSQLSQVSLVGDATNEDGDEGGQDDDDATDDIVQGAAENELPASQQKKRLSRAERLHTLPKEVREFINSTDCRRILMLKHFDDPVIARETVAGCCDNCDPSLCNLYATLPPQLKKPSTRKPHASSPAGVLIAKITEWAEEKTHAPRFEKLVTALSVNNFFPAKLISRIAVECTQTSIITDRLSFDQQIREWDYVDEYGAELWDLVKDNIAGQPEFDRSIGIDHQSTPSGTQIRPIQLADWSDVINQRLNNGDVDLQMSLPGIQSPPLLSAPATPHARLEASEFSPSLGRLRMMRNFLTPVRSDTMQRTAPFSDSSSLNQRPERNALSPISFNIRRLRAPIANNSERVENRLCAPAVNDVESVQNQIRTDEEGAACISDILDKGKQAATFDSPRESEYEISCSIEKSHSSIKRKKNVNVNSLQGTISSSRPNRKRARRFDE